MSKYIDAVGLKIKLGKRLADDERRIKEIVKETIDSMPTIDIVHCDDCSGRDLCDFDFVKAVNGYCNFGGIDNE